MHFRPRFDIRAGTARKTFLRLVSLTDAYNFPPVTLDRAFGRLDRPPRIIASVLDICADDALVYVNSFDSAFTQNLFHPTPESYCDNLYVCSHDTTTTTLRQLANLKKFGEPKLPKF